MALGIIEGFKLEKNPIMGPRIDPIFSPVCRCPQRVAHITFRLRNSGELTLQVVGPTGAVVRTIADNRRFFRGVKHFVWNGRDDAGRRLPDAAYKLRLHFGGQHRTITLPRGTRIDTKPPRVALLSARPAAISPDGDHVNDQLAVRYHVSEQAHVRLVVDGKVAVRGAFTRQTGTLYWPGTVGGVTLPAGPHHVSLVADDLAGNVSRPSRGAAITIRFVELSPRFVRARHGTRFVVRVRTDARVVRWRWLGRRGASKARRLSFPASKLGLHPLVVVANGHSARSIVDVVKR